MKNGPEATSLVLAVNDPSDPGAGVIGYVPQIATEEGVSWTILAGGSSGQVSPIDVNGAWEGLGVESRALAVRSAPYARRFDDVSQVDENTSAFFGQPFLDFGTSTSFYGLFTNSAVYGYDIATDDGSAMGIAAVESTGTISSTLQSLVTVTQLYADSGAAGLSVRLFAASGPNVGSAASTNALLIQPPGEWTLNDEPAAATAATATRGASGAGSRNVLKSIHAKLIGVAAIAAPISVVVRDGATGVGAILWSTKLFAPAVGSKDEITLGSLNIVGSDDTAMTVEFTAVPGATNFEVVSATGITA